MRLALATLVLASALAPDTARGDAAQRDVERLVAAHVRALAKGDYVLGLAPDAPIVVEMIDAAADTTDPPLAVMFNSRSATFKLGAAIVEIGDGFAWFQLPYDKHVPAGPDPMATGDVRDYDGAYRAAGIAIATPKGWQIAAIHHALLVPDKLLLDPENQRNRGYPVDAPKITGDAALGKAVASWIATGFAAHAATKTTLIASGTAPTEAAVGAKTAALVKTWDGLKLVAGRDIHAHVYAGGKVGFASTDVMMPRKQKGEPVMMTLTVVAVRDGDAWRWVVLQFSA
jgi:hypothetical protein